MPEDVNNELSSVYKKSIQIPLNMQIMEGNIIENINRYHSFFSHIHTGGNPGRNEIDETQELYYPAIMQAIVKTGYKGFVGQEFVPKQADPIASLEKCIRICDV